MGREESKAAIRDKVRTLEIMGYGSPALDSLKEALNGVRGTPANSAPREAGK